MDLPRTLFELPMCPTPLQVWVVLENSGDEEYGRQDNLPFSVSEAMIAWHRNGTDFIHPTHIFTSGTQMWTTRQNTTLRIIDANGPPWMPCAMEEMLQINQRHSAPIGVE